MPIEPAIPGTWPSCLPIPFHQAGKKVRGLYHSDPLTMLTTTQAMTPSQLIDAKSMSASS